MFSPFKTCYVKLLSILLLSIVAGFNVKVFAQVKIVYAEYFVDVDPGFKKGNSIPFTPAENLTNLSISIDTTGMTAGIHSIGVRALDENGAWSNSQNFLIYKPFNSANQVGVVPKIVYAEFFVNSSAGYGKATPITISPSVNITNVSISTDTTGLKPGIQILTVRALDENGIWSLDQSYLFYKPFAPNSNPVDSIEEVVYAEYYIDNDPGFGKAISLNVTSSKQLKDVIISLDTAGIGSGIHFLSLRAKNKKGAWSLNQILPFFRPSSTSSQSVLPAGKIVYAEYFVNNDPGYNKASAITLSPAVDLSNMVIQLDTSLLTNGPNTIALRGKDEYGRWSLNQVFVVYKFYPTTDTLTTPPQVTYLEYFVNDDPGLGKATPVPFTHGTNVVNLPVNVNTVGWEVGNYTFYLRARDTIGNWSLVQKWPFRIEVPSGYVITVGSLPDTLCAGQTIRVPYTVNAPFGTNNIFKAQLSNSSGSFTNPIEIGSLSTKDSDTIIATLPANVTLGGNYRIRVLASTPFDTSEVNGNPIRINRAPFQFSLIGKTLVCLGNENYFPNFTESSINNLSYIWQLSSGGNLTANAANATVNWTTGGEHVLKLTAKNYCGIKNDSLLITVADKPLTGPFTNMLPSDSNSNLSLPITFSWYPISDATGYDLYIWLTGQSRPINPRVSNITGINYTLYSGLDYEKYYKWQIIAKKACHTLESPVQTFQLRYLPDLIVNNIQLPVSAFSGQNLSVRWEIKNTGQGSTLNQQWYDLVYLSQDAVFDNTDLFLGSMTNVSALASNESYVQNKTFKLPQGLNDNFYIFVHTNPYNQVQENQLNNNRQVSSNTVFIQLTPPPDLRVTSVVAPNFAFSNENINITYTVSNAGTGATRANQWTDYLYLSKDSVFNSAAVYANRYHHVGELNENENYSATRTVKLPDGIFGKYFVFVVTDIFDQVYEHASENNNRGRSDSINVLLTPPIDLVVSEITIPASASNRQQVTIKWKVANNGGSSTAGKAWTDNIYISKIASFNLDSSILLGGLYHYTEVDAGADYSAQQNVTIPGNLNGNYYIYVFTDASKTVFEYTFDNNNVSRSINSIQVFSPDLIVTDVTTPAGENSGNNISIGYKIKNKGPGTLVTATNSDKFYLSTSATYNPASLIELMAIAYNTGTLLPNDSSIKNAQVKLPNGINGNYYIYIVTDASNGIFEASGENNNTARSNAINIALSPWADLVVDSIQIPDSATAGDVIPILFVVANNGNKSTVDSNWTDEIYLSASQSFIPSEAIKVREVIRSRPLQIDSMYAVISQVKVPGNILQGNYYVHVFTDTKNTIYEHTDEGNNSRFKGKLFIKRYPPVDLIVYNVAAPASGSSGLQVVLSYSVKNQGVVQTLQGQWNDAVYLSTDAVWNKTTDILVKDFVRKTTLIPGQFYSATETVNLPNGLSGSYYLLVVTDLYDVNKDVNRANNVGSVTTSGGAVQAITINLSPSSDLIVTSLKLPDEGPAGQPVMVHFKVKNVGVAVTEADSWTDKVYISDNLILDAGDQVLGSYIRSDSLQPGMEYADSLQIFLPVNASGNHVIIFKADANDKIYEHLKENNNSAIALITIVKPPLSDVVVADIAVPLTPVSAGENAKIDWKVKNIGANPALGYMKEAVYLSLDTIKDISDVLLQTIDGYINLPVQGTADHTITKEITGVSLKDYYILVHTDIVNNIAESNDSNNISHSANKLVVSIPQLVLNVPAARVLNDNKEAYYRIEIPDGFAGESMLVTLKGDSVNGANELYIRYGEVPTRVEYDQSHSLAYEGNQEVIVPVLKGGTYYLMIYGNTSNGSQQQITSLATILPFEIRTVNANKGGNSGRVTVLIRGSKFADVTKIRLLKNQLAVDADSIKIIDPTKLFATFNLLNSDLGVYDVLAENEKLETATLVNGFEILPASAAGLQTSLITPPSTRPSNIVGLVVQFTNAGNTDIINPQIILTSLGGSPLAKNVSELNNSMVTELILTLHEVNGPVGILRPGASGSITVYTKAISALMFSLSQP